MRMMRSFLSTGNINKIDLYMVGIEVYLHYSTSYINQKHFNILKSASCVEKLIVGQVITLNKSVMIRKKSLVTVTPSIKYSQIMNGTYNAKSPSIKMSIMMKA